MKGETTVGQRTEERLRKLEQIRKFYSQWYHLDDHEWASNLVSAMIEHACYLALYEGVDYDTVAAEAVKDTRYYFPDIIG